MASAIPTEEGFYWAKWRQCTSDYPESGSFTASTGWEVVEVWINDPMSEPGDDEYLMVFVGGVRESQPVENFYWGRELMPVKKPLNINQN